MFHLKLKLYLIHRFTVKNLQDQFYVSPQTQIVSDTQVHC